MSTVRGTQFARDHPRALAAVLTVVGYVVVIGTLYGDVGIYPEISEATVDLLAHAIAVVNAATIGALLRGSTGSKTTRWRNTARRCSPRSRSFCCF